MVVAVGLAAIDAREFADFFHQLIRAAHGAGEGAADAEVKFAGSRLAEAGVKCHDLDDFDRLKIEFFRDPLDGFVGDEAELVLNDVEKGKCRGAFAGWVVRNALVGGGFELGRDRERREEFRAGGFGRGDEFVEGGLVRLAGHGERIIVF